MQSSIQNIQRWVERLRSRLTILQYISLHLVAGLVISAVCLWIFAELAEEVFTEQEFTLIDNVIVHELHAAATPMATRFFVIVSAFGYQFLWVIAIGVGIFFILKRDRLKLWLWIAALVGGQVLNLLLKQWFARARPAFDDPLAVALFYSFPSGHATMSLISYGLLAYTLWLSPIQRWQRWLAVTAFVLLILLIGLSRLYLGVHYFSDVLGGFAAGGLWLSFCITGMRFLRDRQARRNSTVRSL